MLSGTVTPTSSWGSRCELALIPITVKGWPSTKIAGSLCRLVIPRLAAAARPMTATFCACVSWNWLKRVPVTSFTPAAASRPGLAAVTGIECSDARKPSANPLTTACLNSTGQ